ncbi:uncharacterized protein LOC143030250 [Oratosquilla oratoria]|uniref:uncharacterized protein LOC143030250 n=1 Tax=Oratosquilla oratoria TaxID=337810 RepID=UPI003F761630
MAPSRAPTWFSGDQFHGDGSRSVQLEVSSRNLARRRQPQDGRLCTWTRPERRTAIVTRELSKQSIDIAALSETRQDDEGQLRETGGGYTFYWKGKPATEPRIYGVGFAIKNNIINLLCEYPVGINERLIQLRLKLANNQHVTVLSAYAPTQDAEDVVKETFYSCLDETIRNIKKEDKLVLLGDFNARVGREYDLWNGVIGRHGVGNTNANGHFLLTTCADHNLVITNTIFRQKTRFKTTWRHPRSGHWHLLDYVIVCARDIADVRITRSMIDADDCWTDHRLIRSIMSFKLPPRHTQRSKQHHRKLNLSLLNNEKVAKEFQHNLEEKLSSPNASNNIHESWDNMKTNILNISEDTLGYLTRKNQDWFDENDQEIAALIERKRLAMKKWKMDTNSIHKKLQFKEAKSAVQSRTRSMKNDWFTRKAQELQSLADTHNTHEFFKAAKTMDGPSTVGPVPLRTKDGSTLLKDKRKIKTRWEEHFSELFNNDSPVDETIFGEIPQHPIHHDLADAPQLPEVVKSIKQLKYHKSAGPDGIPAEIFKCGGTSMANRVLQLFTTNWTEEQLPNEWRDATIVTIFKKGDRSDCAVLPESQCGFRSNRGTVDMIFTARQLQEKAREQYQPLYMTFFDLTKAFDSVNRSALWRILSHFGCPDKYINIMRLFHDNM